MIPGSPERERARQESGFTLLELLVALALSAVISLCISTVGTQAQRIYNATTSKVEVYKKFRYALTDMTHQLENMIVTSDLEFFVDEAAGARERNGHWEEGEELRGDNPNLEGGLENRYDEGAKIIERTYTVDDGVRPPTDHANFSIYFKSPVEIDGVVRIANVEYFLADPSDEEGLGRIPDEVEENQKFALRKVVRYIDTNESNFFKREIKTKQRYTDLCLNVTDLKIEYFDDNLGDNRPGRFLTPTEERSGEIRSETGITTTDRRGVVKSFLYGGFRDLSGNRGTAKRATRNTQTSEFTPVEFRVEGTRFSQLNRGDQIYIWSDSQSDFDEGDYTVLRKNIERGTLIFEESIDSSFWSTDQGGLRYKAGYIPSALRVTVRVLNDDGREPRTISMVVHPFRKK